MKLADLHCDTLWQCYKEGIPSIRKNTLHIDLERGNRYSPWMQCFAAWMPDENRGKAAQDVFEKMSRIYEKFLLENADRMYPVYAGADIEAAASEGKCASIFAVEGGSAAGGTLAGIRWLYEKGVRMMTLTWNKANEIGGGADEPGSLTPFGKEAVREMERLGMVIDVSHASDPLFWSVAENTEKPFVATHSDSRAVCPHRRNLTDEEFLEICRRGGLVGLNFTREFLSEEGDRAVPEDILQHAEHFLALGGENVLAMGSDFDGTVVPDGITGIESMEEIAEMFLRHNYSEKLVSKIFYENAHKFFQSL